MQDDLLQYFCKSPTGGHTQTNSSVRLHQAESALGYRQQTGFGGGMHSRMLLNVMNVTPNTSYKRTKQ